MTMKKLLIAVLLMFSVSSFQAARSEAGVVASLYITVLAGLSGVDLDTTEPMLVYIGSVGAVGGGIWMLAAGKVAKVWGISLIVLDENSQSPYQAMLRAQFPGIDSQEGIAALADRFEAKLRSTPADSEGKIRFEFSRAEVEADLAGTDSAVVEKVYQALK
jgi:hypothetical protein